VALEGEGSNKYIFFDEFIIAFFCLSSCQGNTKTIIVLYCPTRQTEKSNNKFGKKNIFIWE